eukprot:2336898-Amphidinium_carterae.1
MVDELHLDTHTHTYAYISSCTPWPETGEKHNKLISTSQNMNGGALPNHTILTSHRVHSLLHDSAVAHVVLEHISGNS